MFDDLTGTLVIHVPYCSTGPSVTGPLAGEVGLVFASVSAVEMLVREGEVFHPGHYCGNAFSATGC
ncbi:hypothetical protein [Belnapia moabensis]|uniref:hypothetical protein n=1 Tax=Belnapia moabensis TaxID=365533 RepID=UPI0012EDF757|nr:hypothetical protein [Belnapia moabensis]